MHIQRVVIHDLLDFKKIYSFHNVLTVIFRRARAHSFCENTCVGVLVTSYYDDITTEFSHHL